VPAGEVSDSVEVIDRTVSTTNVWLKTLAERLGLDRHRAYLALRAVLHALRDRVGPEVAAHVSAQLPTLIRGVFYEGWDPTRTPARLSLEQFLARIQTEALLADRTQAEHAATAVVGLLWDELGQGTMDHLVDVLPSEYALIF